MRVVSGYQPGLEGQQQSLRLAAEAPRRVESSPQGDRPVVSLPYNESVTGRIFISYRREDAGGHVLALMPWLSEHFGDERIFKDTDSIGVGRDFIDTIQRELESCSVVLVVIGHEWLTVSDQRLNAPRLHAPDDVVRLEVATALKAQVPVIPVLVARATMPAAEDLPPELRPLARINAIELSDARWKADVLRLVGAIEQASGGRTRWRSATLLLKRLFHGKARVVSTVLALAVVLGASRFFVPARQLQSSTGGTPSLPSVAAHDARGTSGSVESAWRYYDNGARADALDTALQGLSSNPADASLKTLLRMMRRDAEDDANLARQAAIAAGASRATGGDFALGIRNVANATRVRDTDQPPKISAKRSQLPGGLRTNRHWRRTAHARASVRRRPSGQRSRASSSAFGWPTTRGISRRSGRSIRKFGKTSKRRFETASKSP
jgi:hypothetical protein